MQRRLCRYLQYNRSLLFVNTLPTTSYTSSPLTASMEASSGLTCLKGGRLSDLFHRATLLLWLLLAKGDESPRPPKITLLLYYRFLALF